MPLAHNVCGAIPMVKNSKMLPVKSPCVLDTIHCFLRSPRFCCWNPRVGKFGCVQFLKMGRRERTPKWSTIAPPTKKGQKKNCIWWVLAPHVACFRPQASISTFLVDMRDGASQLGNGRKCHGGGSIAMGVPPVLDGLQGKKNMKMWMITRGSPILGNLHITHFTRRLEDSRQHGSCSANIWILKRNGPSQVVQMGDSDKRGNVRCKDKNWLVVWNIFYFPIYWE